MHGIAGLEFKVVNLYEQVYLFSEQRRVLGWFINMNMKYYLEDAEQTSFILWETCKKYNEIFLQRIIFFWANYDSTFDRNQNMLLPWLSNDSHWLFILCIDCTRLDYSSGLRFDWAISSKFKIFCSFLLPISDTSISGGSVLFTSSSVALVRAIRPDQWEAVLPKSD